MYHSKNRSQSGTWLWIVTRNAPCDASSVNAAGGGRHLPSLHTPKLRGAPAMTPLHRESYRAPRSGQKDHYHSQPGCQKYEFVPISLRNFHTKWFCQVGATVFKNSFLHKLCFVQVRSCECGLQRRVEHRICWVSVVRWEPSTTGDSSR